MKNDDSAYQQALTVKQSSLKGFKNWKTEFDGKDAMYYSLYPQSWIVYKLPMNVILTCHQLSPILPNNYKVFTFLAKL